METKIEHWVCIQHPNVKKGKWPQITFPTKGKVYTMRAIFDDPANEREETFKVCYLNELTNPPVPIWGLPDGVWMEPFWPLYIFRKLDKLRFESKINIKITEDV